ncbi:MAG: hypothetical protein E6H03_06590 [Bacillati bacterium ANGP1]|uniref:Uncharacterized protein n=1 Tax=Candidatus Segetimicrobium genomatis TaxID=2569760 RepID=A0A537JDV2_9BACT|nr:MAG: hypothetical protein E6H03_06590 [Terrabacteria group bacterium ANGP1]
MNVTKAIVALGIVVAATLLSIRPVMAGAAVNGAMPGDSDSMATSGGRMLQHELMPADCGGGGDYSTSTDDGNSAPSDDGSTNQSGGSSNDGGSSQDPSLSD